jgi:putative CocE/NonD family hydrolase
LCARAGNEFARANQYLIAGPWHHFPWGDRVGGANFGNEALLDTDAIVLRWFNHWLKDSGEFRSEARVRYFVLGENVWRNAAALPAERGPAKVEGPAEAVQRTTTLYLHSGGRANSRKGDGRLNAAKAASNEPCDVFVYDPEVPVGAPGGSSAQSGPFDQATLELGNNVLAYTSEPLERALRVFGFPCVSLHCSSSAGFTDFTAKLVRVRANGVADFICIGIARSSRLFAESSYSADKIHRWQFRLEPTSCRFDAGDCVRLEIASSAFPLYDRNPGSGVASCQATSWDWKRSTQMLYHDPARPSLLELPVCEDGE